jgi:hypothetical protein
MCCPVAPASMQAMWLTASIHSTRFMRRMSTAITKRCSLTEMRSASVTFVPPPKGITQASCFLAVSTSRTTSSWLVGKTTRSGTRSSAR